MKLKKSVKNNLRLFVPKFLFNPLRYYVIKTRVKDWERKGCPFPVPHVVKQYAIAEYQKKYNHDILVETGTYKGDMIEAQKTIFNKLVSIELGKELFEAAQSRFKNDKHITIVHGDSGKVLPDVIKNIEKPAIFWLDGHYSAGITAKGDKDCPIFEELDAILNDKRSNHILLIDDANLFAGKGDYPTLDELKSYINSKNDSYDMQVKHDIIRFVVHHAD